MKPLNIKLLSTVATLLFFSWFGFAHAAVLTLPPNNLGLVGYWPMNEGASTIAGDFSGNRNHGTLTNMDANTDWVNGKRGKALDFDGNEDHVLIGDLDIFEPQSLTLSFWAKIRNPARSFNGGVAKGMVFGGNDQFSYQLSFHENNVANSLYVGDYSAYQANIAIYDTDWHLWTMTAASGLISAYKDGILMSTTSYSGSIDYSLGSANNSLSIGRNPSNNPSHTLDGLIDDVRIYNRALSADEVARLYKSGQVTRKISNTGLVGYWPMNEGTSTQAGDFSGFNNHGTLTNMDANTDWVNGKRGKALDFDGSDDRVAISDAPLLRLTNNFTISLWFKSNATNQTDTYLLQKSKTGSPANAYAIIYEYVNDQVEFYSNSYTGSDPRTGSQISINDTNWHNVIYSYDGITWSGYKDGVQIFSVSRTFSIDNSSPADMYLGAANDGFGVFSNFINAKLDDVRIYNRALSAAEIMDIYKSGEVTVNTSFKNRITNGLVGMWTFNGNDMNWTSETAGQAYDRSGQNNHGALTNMARGYNPTIGKVGQALKFDGVDDYVDAGNGSSLDITSDISISFWVNPSGNYSTPGTAAGIISKATGEGATGYVVEENGLGHQISLFLDNTGTGFIPAPNIWTHAVYVYNGTNIVAYENGVATSSVSKTGTFSSTAANLVIGFRTGVLGRYFNGSIDDVRIYNRALDPSEVKQLYLMGK